MDSIKNWYEIAVDKKEKTKLDKNFKKHYILPNSMVICLGNTGVGKTNALVDFLSRKNDAFYDVLIFTGSTQDEPLYNFLKKKMPEIKLFNNIDEFPNLNDFDDDEKKLEK